MILKINGINKDYTLPISLEDIANTIGGSFYCAKVNNRLRELSYIIDHECEIEFNII